MAYQSEGPAPAGFESHRDRARNPEPQGNNTKKAAGNQVNSEQIAKALNGKQSGDGWLAPCPAHDDKNPSLTIGKGRNGSPVVHCLAGCDQGAVISALRSRGLWPSSSFEINHPSRGKPDRAWPYHNEQGQVIGYACRFDKANGEKDVLPFFKHPDGWHWKAPATAENRLYNRHLLTLHPDRPVIVAEGEKATDAAAKLFPGHVALTWQGGSGAAEKADWTALKGRTVTIWPDADAPGTKAANMVANACRLAGSKVAVITPPADVATGWDAADALAEGWTQEQAAGLLTKDQEQADKQENPRALKLVAAAELDLSAAKTEWLIDGIKERATLAIKYGASGSLKTFTELDELLSIAANRPYHGRKVNGGAAVLIAGEGHKGLARRVIGLAEKRGYDLATIPFYLTTAPVEFLNPADVAALRPLLDEIAQKQPIAAISIDTLSRCFGPGDENATKDMNRFVAEVDALRRDYGAAVTVLHHVGHGDSQRERGAYALRGAADWRWLVEHNKGVAKLTCKKAKDHEEPAPIAFKAEQYHLAGQFDEEGRPVTTLVLREVEAKQVESKRQLSATNQQALDALRKIQHGDPVHLDEWREEFYSASTADNQAAKQKAFARARKNLVALGLIQCRDDRYQINQTPGHNPDITRTSPAVSGKTPGQTRTPPYRVSGLSGLSDTKPEENNQPEEPENITVKI